MILRLVLRSLPGRTLYGFAVSLMFASLGIFDALLLAVFPLLGVAAPILAQRATRFEAALPIHARTIVLMRVGVALAAIWIPPWVSVAMASIRGNAGSLAVFTDDYRAVFLLATVLVLLPNVIRPGELGNNFIRTLLVPWSSVLLVGFILLRFSGPAFVMLLLAAITVAAYAIWSRTPASYQVAPVGVPSERVLPSSGWLKLSRRERFQWYPVLRSVVGVQTVLAFGLAAYAASRGVSGLFLFAIFLPTVAYVARQRTIWMYGLPFSHRRLLMINCGVALLPFAVGFAVGSVLPHPPFTAERMTRSAPRSSEWRSAFDGSTNVPITFWKVSTPTGPVATITAPWGETSIADTITVLGTTYYNPYSTLRSSSAAFKEWQFANATTAIYGRPIGSGEYEESRGALVRVTRSTRMKVLIAGMLATIALLMIALGEVQRWRGFVIGKVGRHTLGILPMLPALALLFDQHLSLRARTEILLPRGETFLLDLSRALPPGIVPVVVVAAVPVVLMFLILERQFRKSEFVDRRTATWAWEK